MPLVATITLLSFGLITTSNTVYAEERNVSVPWDVMSQFCYQTGTTEGERVYNCKFTDYPAEFEFQETEAGGMQLLITDVSKPTPETFEPVVEVIQEIEELTPDEQVIQRLQALKDEGRMQPSQEQLLIYLEAAKESCFFGIEEGEAVQTFQHILIPKEYANLDLALDLATVDPLLRHIEQVMEACDGWKNYKGENLGPEYSHKIEAGKIAIQDELQRLQAIQDRQKVFYDSLSEHDILEQQEQAQKISDKLGYITTDERFTGEQRGGQTAGAECHIRPPIIDEFGKLVRAAEPMCPEKAYREHITTEELEEVDAGLQFFCEREYTVYKNRDLAWWPWYLKDGGCVDILDELQKIEEPEFKHQTPETCPDCKQYKED